MAKVNVSVQRKEVIKYEEEEVITLTLSRDEAEALRSLTGPCQCDGPTSSVFDALEEAGINCTYRVANKASTADRLVLVMTKD